MIAVDIFRVSDGSNRRGLIELKKGWCALLHSLDP